MNETVWVPKEQYKPFFVGTKSDSTELELVCELNLWLAQYSDGVNLKDFECFDQYTTIC